MRKAGLRIVTAEEWIMRHATQEWNGGVSIGGKKISNLRYADDAVLLAKTKWEFPTL